MNVEVERLGTFREWPANAAVDAARLAKAGFYYTGHDLEVECFLCGTKISDWNYSDQAMARHREKAPDCPFVVNPASTCNVPLIPIATSRDDVATTSDTRQRNGVGNDPSLDASKRNPLKEYRTVSQRLRSFEKWPITSIIHPERLALAGFYYLQYHDMVECAFCRGILMNWKAGDDPDCEHRLSFPNCDFYLREDIDDDTLGLVRVSSGSTSDVTELGIQKHRAPCRPQYATYERRLQTFAEWPDNLRQTPKMLAAAGFYYVGCNDQVRCFHCDGGLREWQPTDDVWVEHAQWFPTCGFVNLVRGPKFIRHCVNNRTSMNLSDFTNMLEDTDVTTTATSLNTITQSSMPVTDEMVSTAETLAATPSTNLQISEPVTDTAIHTEDVIETSVAPIPTLLQSSESITNAPTSMANVMETSVAFPVNAQPNEPAIDTVILSVADVTEISSASVSTAIQPSELATNTTASVIDISENSHASLPTVSAPSSKPITDTDVEKLLHTTVAKAALEIGLHEGRVKRALKRRMEQIGKPYTNTVQLIQDVLHDQILEEDNRFDNDNFQTSELTNLFDYLNVANNCAHKNNVPESDASESEPEREMDNESDDIMFLREENRKLKESRLCKVCMDRELAIVFLPCGHLATCNNCAPALANCPLCRLKIEAYIRIFFS